MTAHKINSPVVLFNHSEYGDRLLFQKGVSNPRDVLGKMGVTNHSWFASFFYSTITINAELINEKGEKKNHDLYINRNSLIKYLGVAKHSNLNDDELMTALNEKFWDSESNQCTDADKKMQIEAGSKGLRHAGQHNKITINNWFTAIADYVKGSFLGWLYQATISSITRIKARFLFVKTEYDLFDAGEVLAKRRFNEAYDDVPAYKKFVDENKQNPGSNQHFSSIPSTNKTNYIKKQDFDSDLHFHGKYPESSKTDTSTGTTGKATPWVRSTQELETVKKSLKLAADIQFGDRKIETINAFALGPWATGMSAYELARESGSVFAAGPDKEKIIDELLRIHNYEQHQLDLSLQDFFKKNPIAVLDGGQRLFQPFINNLLNLVLKNRGMTVQEAIAIQREELKSDIDKHLVYEFQSEILSISTQLNKEKKQVIIAGYPPFLKDLCDYAAQKGHNFASFSAIGVVGGQAISEAMRDQLKKNGFNQIYSSYGASDLDINLGVETEYEMTVRRAIEQNPGLARELYGENKGLPMVFHYDPMNYHVECDTNDDLIYTCTRNDRSSPRIRYNLEDKGRVYAVSDVEALLTKYGIFQKPKINLPLMFVWGRDSTVVFSGANLAFTELERAITDDESLEPMVLKKAFYTHEDEQGSEQLEIWLELNDEIELPNKNYASNLTIGLLNKLTELNQDIAYQFDRLVEGTELPKVRFFTRGNSPISEAGGQRKQVLVFQKGINLEKGYEFPDESKCYAISILKGAKADASTEGSSMQNPLEI